MAVKKEQNARRARVRGFKEEADEELTAPFTIVCISAEAEVFKISNLDMQGIIRKDRSTKVSIYENYNKKLRYL